MIVRRSFMQKSDSDLLASAETVLSECTQHSAEWVIEPIRLSDFSTEVSGARYAFDANSNKATKNAYTVANKNAAFGRLKHGFSIFINYLDLNSNVPDAALAAMGLRSREHHAHMPLPRPEERLLLSVRKGVDELTVYAMRPEEGHPTLSVAPESHHGFTLRYRMEGDAAEKYVTSTRLHHTLFFDRADEGKRIFLSGAWVNPRLETGQWSEEISEIIGLKVLARFQPNSIFSRPCLHFTGCGFGG